MLFWFRKTRNTSQASQQSASVWPKMDATTHCPDCFQSPAPKPICSNCGFDQRSISDNANLLPVFTSLAGGRYRIGRVLGSPGGFGVVYAGIHVGLSRAVAIKEFFPYGDNRLARRINNSLEVIPDPKRAVLFDRWRQQFLTEARLLASLRHPRVVSVYDLLEERGTAYLVMERLQGVTLAEYLGNLQLTAAGLVVGHRLSSGEVLPLLLAALEALEALHGRPTGPIMHLDLTPRNLLLMDGSPDKLVLIDFGLAYDSTKPYDKSTSAGIGNVAFMAPEQADTKSKIKITPAADCYSLGACLYTAIIGIAPPQPSTRRAGAQLIDLASQVPGLDPALASVVMDCLNLDPTLRPQDAMDIRRRLNGITSSLSQLPPLPTARMQGGLKSQVKPTTKHQLPSIEVRSEDAPKHIERQQRLQRRIRWLWGLLVVVTACYVAVAWYTKL